MAILIDTPNIYILVNISYGISSFGPGALYHNTQTLFVIFAL